MSTTTSAYISSLSYTGAALASGGSYSSSRVDISPFISLAFYYEAAGACTITVSQEVTASVASGGDYVKTLESGENGSFIIAATGLYASISIANTSGASNLVAVRCIASRARAVTETINATITGPITLSEAVTVDNFPATQTVSGSVSVSSLPAVVVQGSDGATDRTILTDSSGRVSVNVASGTISAQQSGAWNVVISNWDASETVPVSLSGQSISVDNHPTDVMVGSTDGGTTMKYLKTDSDGVLATTSAASQSGAWVVTLGATADVNVLQTPPIAAGAYGSGAPTTLVCDSDGALIVAPKSGSVTDVAQNGTWDVNAVQSGSWTVAATQSGTWSVEQSGAAFVVMGSVDVGSITGPIAGSDDGGSTGRILKTDADGELQVDVLTLPILTGTDDGTTARKLLTSSAGRLSVDVNSGSFTMTQQEELKGVSTSDGSTLVGLKVTPHGSLVISPRWATQDWSSFQTKHNGDSSTVFTVNTSEVGVLVVSATAWIEGGSPGNAWLAIYHNDGADNYLCRIPLDITPQNHIPVPLYCAGTLYYKITADYAGTTPLATGHSVYINVITSFA